MAWVLLARRRISRVSGEAVLGMPYEVLMAKAARWRAGRSCFISLGCASTTRRRDRSLTGQGQGLRAAGQGRGRGRRPPQNRTGLLDRYTLPAAAPLAVSRTRTKTTEQQEPGAGAGVGGLSEPASSSSSAALRRPQRQAIQVQQHQVWVPRHPQRARPLPLTSWTLTWGRMWIMRARRGRVLGREGDPFGADASPFGDDGDL